jgi:hypothetical protein
MYKFLLPVVSFLVLSQSQTFAAVDGLQELNAKRASMRLRPFERDEVLSQAAAKAADYRAARHLEGHVWPHWEGRRYVNINDYSFLPAGARCESTGCGAAEPRMWGWMTCCEDEDYRYAGAAWAWGRDGQRYMHLYVSNVPNPKPSEMIEQPAQTESTAQPAAQAGVTIKHLPNGYSWRSHPEGWSYYQGAKQVGFMTQDKQFRWLKHDGTWSEPKLLE